ncbi:hypothetical protein AVEN_46116-1 [Araneus ventricosus]|uniref:Uncharacterized protein n=1 Tax=Araneus ventricosus TaxID=182803 RepID=A0A4Y2ERC3_ARAVE|nr:hypothetical protein AVEN_46116-1 [Araneus ventricosus]
MNWTLPTWMGIYPTTPPHAITIPKAHRNGMWLARIIGLPYLSPKRSQNLPSKEANRLSPRAREIQGLVHRALSKEPLGEIGDVTMLTLRARKSEIPFTIRVLILMLFLFLLNI